MKKLFVVAVLISVFLSISGIHAEPEWRMAGLKDTSLTVVIKAEEFDPQCYLIGTAGNGVYLRYRDETVKVRSNIETLVQQGIDTAFVHALAVMNNTLFAATDNGLWMYPLTRPISEDDISGGGYVSSAWKRCRLPDRDIFDLAIGRANAQLPERDYLFAASNDSIYRGYFVHNEIIIPLEESEVDDVDSLYEIVWETLPASDSLPPGSKAVSFRTLFCNMSDSLYAGSIGSDIISSWSGMLRSLNSGNTWSVWNQGWEDDAVPGIRELEVFRRYYGAESNTYITATDTAQDGLVYIKDGDDGRWVLQESLREATVNGLYVTYETRSQLAVVHAGADKGVFVSKNETSVPEESEGDEWELMKGSPEHVRSLAADVKDRIYDSLYVATVNGLYLYTDYDDTEISGSREYSNGGYGSSVDVRFLKGTSGIRIAGLPYDSDFSIRIYDLKGSLVHSEEGVKKGEVFIAGKEFLSGAYIVDLRTSELSIQRKLSVCD